MAASSPTSFSPSNIDHALSDRPSSPTAPSYSPITPTMSIALPATNTMNAAAQGQQQSAYPHAPPIAHVASSRDPLHIQTSNQDPQPGRQQQPPAPLQTSAPPTYQSQYPLSEHIEQLPPAQPISESDNSDAIALRTTMRILWIQRQQAMRDLKKLEKQKEAAIRDPEKFARAVQEGRIKARRMQGVGPYTDGNGDEDTSEEEEEEEEEEEAGDTAMEITPQDTSTTAPAHPVTAAPPSDNYEDFGEIPSKQNVVRMPPINWAKYHVVGESLDKLHQEQRIRPSPGQPARDEDLRPRERAPVSVIAAPYDPWEDKVGTKDGRKRNSGGAKGTSKGKRRGGGKKKKGGA